MDRITSSGNPRIKAIRQLRDRKTRQQSGTYYLEGIRLVAEAFNAPGLVDTIIAAPDLITSEVAKALLDRAHDQNIPILEVSSEVFQSLSTKDGPQGIGAVAHQQWRPITVVQAAQGKDWLALDSIADPGNLGTILRTSDAAGFEGIILLDQSTDPYDPGSVRASMGAVLTQTLVRVNFEEFAAWQANSKFTLVGTSGSSALDYHRTDYPSPLILLMGSERQGLQERYLRLCDKVVSIPMRGSSDSLNLAVATGIVLYEIMNRRRDHSAAGG